MFGEILCFIGFSVFSTLIYHFVLKRYRCKTVKIKDFQRKSRYEEIVEEYSGKEPLKVFEVNEFLTLKLIEKETVIYVNGEFFLTCKYLLINIRPDQYYKYSDLNGIDEVAETLNHELEVRNRDVIPPEVEFWGHCSNLQAWYENNYDTRLLHRNLEFPLLKRLTEAGDPKAKRVFKEEIIKRLLEGHYPVIVYLMTPAYLFCFTFEELQCLLEDLKKLYKNNGPFNIHEIISDTLEGMGHEFSFMEECNKAIIMYQYAMEFNPKEYSYWEFLGSEYIKNGEFKKGVRVYKSALKFYDTLKYPYKNLWDYGEILQKLCYVYLVNGKYDIAVETGKKALKFNSKLYLPWYYLSIAYKHQRKVKDALYSFINYKFLKRRANRTRNRGRW